MAQEAKKVNPKQEEKVEVSPLPPVFYIDNSRNIQLENGVESRYPNVSIKYNGKVIPFVVQGTPVPKMHPDTKALVYACVLAMASATSKGGDGAMVWLYENLKHPRVASLLRDGNEIAFEVGSSRTGIAGYRYPASAIRAAVEALAPALENSIKEFGYPAAATRGGNEKQQDFEVDWDLDLD